MGLRRDLDDLAKMYSEGGLIILTTADGENLVPVAPSSGEPYKGRVYDQNGLRTAIQLDGDVVTAVSRDVLYDEVTWRDHMAKVDAKLGIVVSIQKWVRRSWMLFLIIPYGSLLPNALAQGSVRAVVLAAFWTAVWTYVAFMLKTQLLTVLKFVVLPLVRRLMGWYLSRQLGDFLTGKAS